MTDTMVLNENYSTTRLVTLRQPVITPNIKEAFQSLLYLPIGEERKGEGGLRLQGFFKNSYDNEPVVSIITVVYNGEKYLEETILSIINQSYDNVEYIIIDGGSTDGTLDIIRKYENQIDYWLSEKDNGIYDAMNKGITLFQGDYIWFINAGDMIYDSKTIERMLSLYPNADVMFGDTQLIDSHGRNKKLVKSPETLTWESFAKGMVVSHQSIIIHRSLVELYNLQYKFVADHDWIVNGLKNANNIVNTNMILSKYLLDGFSQNNFRGCWKDKFLIVSKHYGISVLVLNYFYFIKAYTKQIIKRMLKI